MAQPNPHAGVVRSKRPLYSSVITIVTIAMVLGLFMVALAQPSISPPTVSAAGLTVDLDQCANQTTPCSWQNGDLNGNNSTYAEGDVVPFRLAIEGLNTGSHTIHINYDFTAGGHEAYDFLADYNATETVDLCASGGGGVSSLCPSLPAPNIQAFPSDPFVVPGTLGSLSVAGAEAFSGVSRNLTLFGGTITSITGPVHSGPTSGNSTGDFTVTFTAAGSAVLFAWGGHLAQSAYWINSDGSPDGAGQVSGAPWHMRTQNLDGAGNKNQDRSIQPSALQAPTPTPTNTPTNTPTDTPTNTPTDTPTNTPTDTPTNTPTDTPTDTPTNTPTDTPTNTPTDTPTNTPTDTPTNTPTDTPTNTPTNTPTPIVFEGCTPGFWKQSQHLDSWVGFSPDQTLESVFDVPDSFGLDNVTLLQALSFQGGSSTKEAAQILLRAAVAALLNSTSVDFPLTTQQVIDAVNTALASNDRNTILSLAAELDRLNNAGCPLS